MSRKTSIARAFMCGAKKDPPRKPYRCASQNHLPAARSLPSMADITERLLPARFSPISLLDTPRKLFIMKRYETPIR